MTNQYYIGRIDKNSHALSRESNLCYARKKPMPAHYREPFRRFINDDPSAILGRLICGSDHDGFADHWHAQTRAWQEQNSVLQCCCKEMLSSISGSPSWELLLEYPIPRRAKRIDAVIIAADLIIVIEFKTGKRVFELADVQQVEDYCLDLRDFHARSNDRTLLPVLVVPNAPFADGWPGPIDGDHVQSVHLANSDNLVECIAWLYHQWHSPGTRLIDPREWDESPYHPTPTIIEAAQSLYAGHDVREISRSHAGADNLTKTVAAVLKVIEDARQRQRKAICFVTGVPGSGKTLAGLNIVHNPTLQAEGSGLGVFLSGNGPLVKVLREALARDHSSRNKIAIRASRRRVSTFVQNVHTFVKEYIDNQPEQPPLITSSCSTRLSGLGTRSRRNANSRGMNLNRT